MRPVIGGSVTLGLGTGAAGRTAQTTGRNRAIAAWLRVQISELAAELLRAEAYGDRQLTSAEIRQRLTSMLEGREAQR